MSLQLARSVSKLPTSLQISTRTFSATTSTFKKASAPTLSAAISSPSSSKSARPQRILTFSKKSGTSNFKTFLPVTPSLRHLRQPISEHLHKGDPLRALTIAKRATGGRNSHGRITTRARGGGHKRRIRLVDFHRKEVGEQIVQRIEYDPGRSAHIALIKHSETGNLSYILAPSTLREGDTVQSFRSGIPESFTTNSSTNPSSNISTAFGAGSANFSDPSSPQTVLPPPNSSNSNSANQPTQSNAASLSQIDLGVLRSVAIRPGNCLPLRLIPVGTLIHAITLNPSGAAVLERSAGASARIISAASPSGKHAQIKLSSGEVRLIGLECVASIGTVSNQDHQHANLGKAGRMRWLGFRPQSRGVAMNATDHPHGGGRGKSKGNNHPVDVWGNGAKGTRTRPPKSKNGNKFVVKERPRGTEKNQKGR